MSGANFSGYVQKHRWLIATILVVLGGYTIGKDIALRENARDMTPLSGEAN